MEPIPLLKQLGLTDKEIKVYLALLKCGHASVRQLVKLTEINRGTAYDLLKSLKDLGLVSYYHQATKQFFVAEDPLKLKQLLEQQLLKLGQVKKHLNQVIPELASLFNQAGVKPVVKYYEGRAGVKAVLSDVLATMNTVADKLYYVFSSSAIRPHLYRAFPLFTRQRIRSKIKVKVIALGHAGTLADLSERKSLTAKVSSPTYILVYKNKVAMISVNALGEPLGLIIEDPAIFETQKQLFEFIWQSL